MSKLFEIHITGDYPIIEASSELKVKSIVIDLLKPDKSVLRSEYMTSFVMCFLDLNYCLQYVHIVKEQLKDLGVNILRTKVETPYYSQYVDNSLYMESHYDTKETRYPISRSHHKKTYLVTQRTYDKNQYMDFILKHKGHLELCMYDDNIQEDKTGSIVFRGYRKSYSVPLVYNRKHLQVSRHNRVGR